MKKIIYIFCILLFSLNLISCGNKETIVSDKQNTKEKEITHTSKTKMDELKVDTFTTNDNYVKAKWVYGPTKDS